MDATKYWGLNPVEKGLLTTMQNHFLVAFANSEKMACDIRDTFRINTSRRSYSFFSELANATKNKFAWW